MEPRGMIHKPKAVTLVITFHPWGITNQSKTQSPFTGGRVVLRLTKYLLYLPPLYLLVLIMSINMDMYLMFSPNHLWFYCIIHAVVLTVLQSVIYNFIYLLLI